MVGGVEPLIVPTLVHGRSWNQKVLLGDFLPELDYGFAHDFGPLAAREGLEMEKIVERIEMGLDAQIRLAEMNENADLEDGVGIEMEKLNPVEIKKAVKESMRGEAESPLKERLKHHDLAGLEGREFLTYHQPPSRSRLVQQHVIPDEALQPLPGGAR